MRKIAPIFVFLAGILWGSMGLFVRRFHAAGLSSMDIVCLRCILTAVLMVPVLLVYDRKLFRIRLKDIWCFLGTGICSIVFFNFCYFKAITMTSLAVAAILLYTSPVFVILLSRLFFQEKLTKKKFFTLISAFIGCVLVTGAFGSGESVTFFGVLIGLSAGLGYALYSIFSRFALERGYRSLTITFYTFLFASVGSVFFADQGKILKVSFGDMKMTGFSLVFAVVSTVIPYLIYTVGLSYMENGKAAVLACIEPVTASLLGICFFHEKLFVTTILGMILVLAAAMVSGMEKTNKP